MKILFCALTLFLSLANAETKGPEFIWKEVTGATGYQLEVSKSRDFKTIILERKVQDTSYRWMNPVPGTYFWRVRAIDGENHLGELSAPGLLQITIPAPVIIDRIRNIKGSVSKELVELKWISSPYAKKYEVEISKNPSFSNPEIITTQTNSLKKELDASEPLLWRVRPLNADNENIGQFSEVGLVQFSKQLEIASTFPVADATVEPVADDLLLINEKRYYIEDVDVRLLTDRQKDAIIRIRVFGMQKWDSQDLTASTRCFGEKSFRNLAATNLDDAWVMIKARCESNKTQFCLSESSGKQACSGWLDSQFKKLPPAKAPLPIEKKSFVWKGAVPLYWNAADGRSMQIVWNKALARDPASKIDFKPPNYFLSGLVSGVRVQTRDTNSNTQSNTLLMASLQAAYWPDASPDGDLHFTSRRIGGQIRYSQSISSIPLANGQSLSVSWADFSLNYRREPSNIFEGNHIYGILMGSSFTTLGRATNRLGGGLGVSAKLPETIFGIKHKGLIYTYLDGTVLPFDASGDSRGPVYASKLNSVWLFGGRWFLTGDIEVRLLNLAMDSENSVLRVQLGAGLSF